MHKEQPGLAAGDVAAEPADVGSAAALDRFDGALHAIFEVCLRQQRRRQPRRRQGAHGDDCGVRGGSSSLIPLPMPLPKSTSIVSGGPYGRCAAQITGRSLQKSPGKHVTCNAMPRRDSAAGPKPERAKPARSAGGWGAIRGAAGAVQAWSLTQARMCCATATSSPFWFTTLMSLRERRLIGSTSTMV